MRRAAPSGLGQLTAPQYGLWATLPPATDNPAARRAVPCPAHIRQRLRELRDEFARRAGR